MDIGDIQSRRYDLPTLVLKKYPYRTYAALATSVSECLVDVALYRKSDGLDHSKRQATNWRRDALIYYNANGVYHGEGSKDAWCHVSGKWFHEEDIKAAHIQLVTLPFFLDFGSIGGVLFGERAPSIGRAGNALLMSERIKHLFDTVHLPYRHCSG